MTHTPTGKRGSYKLTPGTLGQDEVMWLWRRFMKEMVGSPLTRFQCFKAGLAAGLRHQAFAVTNAERRGRAAAELEILNDAEKDPGAQG